MENVAIHTDSAGNRVMPQIDVLDSPGLARANVIQRVTARSARDERPDGLLFV
jgi:hypothetical protein